MAKEGIMSRASRALNVFMGRDAPREPIGYGDFRRTDRYHLWASNEKTVITGLVTKISIDVGQVSVMHAMVDENDNFVEQVRDGLNECLTLEANIDQSAPMFIRDICTRMMDQGTVAVVVVDRPTDNPDYGVSTLRCGTITEWFPRAVKVKLYDDRPNRGKHQELILPKEKVAIIENPLYNVMNAPNGTYMRLLRVLSQVDKLNEKAGSKKLNAFIKLPYSLKSPTKQEQANARLKMIDAQLQSTEYGLAYLDQAENIQTAGGGYDNSLWEQAKDLKTELYNQLGISEEVIKGTADEQQMLNYYSSTIEPIMDTITKEFTRKFISKWSRTLGHRVVYLRDPFKLVPLEKFAQVADTFTRNAIFTSNEIRGLMGYKPSDQPEANELRNKNIAAGNDQVPGEQTPGPEEGEMNTDNMTDEEIQQYMDSL